MEKESNTTSSTDNIDTCLVCGTEVPPGPDFCGSKCETRYNEEVRSRKQMLSANSECPNPDVCGCKHEPLKLTPEGEAAALSAIELAHRHDCGDENCDHTVQDEIDNPTGAPPMLPEQLTRKQIGALRRAHITVTHGSVIKCGHKAKFGPTKTPGNNCVHCWEAFFQTAVDLEALHTLVTTEGPKGMEKKYGTKFMRNFHGFLATELMRSPALPPSTEGFNIPNLEESIPHEHREEVHEATA